VNPLTNPHIFFEETPPEGRSGVVEIGLVQRKCARFLLGTYATNNPPDFVPNPLANNVKIQH